MRKSNITKIVWLSLFLGLAFAQEIPGDTQDTIGNYRYREQYMHQEHMNGQGDTIRIMSRERIRNEGDTIQIQNRKRIENPAVETEITTKKTVTKGGDNVIKIEKKVVTPNDTVIIQKKIVSSEKDTIRNRELQRKRGRDARCDGEPDTLRVRKRERIRLIDGTSSPRRMPGTGIGIIERRGRRGN